MDALISLAWSPTARLCTSCSPEVAAISDAAAAGGMITEAVDAAVESTRKVVPPTMPAIRAATAKAAWRRLGRKW
jgi:hypothetical protein